MAKYKIGDKVRVRKDLNKGTKYYVENSTVWDDVVGVMLRFAGKDVIIKEVRDNGKYIIEGTDTYNWTDEMFAGKVNENKIVITTDGKETLARLYEGNKVIKTATAKCSPDDEFNFETGAKIAFDRLIGEKSVETPEEKPKYYNGKVVCVEKVRGYAYTAGKIYEFKDGRVENDNGYNAPCEALTALDEWNKRYSCYCKFIPLVD